jgi:hypothetical protein
MKKAKVLKEYYLENSEEAEKAFNEQYSIDKSWGRAI